MWYGRRLRLWASRNKVNRQDSVLRPGELMALGNRTAHSPKKSKDFERGMAFNPRLRNECANAMGCLRVGRATRATSRSKPPQIRTVEIRVSDRTRYSNRTVIGLLFFGGLCSSF